MWIRLLFTLWMAAAVGGADPLLTPEVPAWARDAVYMLREKGIFSAGMTPHRALARSEMMPLLDSWLEQESRAYEGLAPRSELDELRVWLKSLQDQSEQLQQRVDSL